MKLPEAPPVLSAEQLKAMSLDELKAEDTARFDLYKEAKAFEDIFCAAWLPVYTAKQEREKKEAMREEILAELQASLPHPQPQPESMIQNETTATN